jgi:hypothetical protein
MGTLTGVSRQTASFFSANSPGGGTCTATNNGDLTFATFSSVGSVIGCHVWDGSPVGSSNMLIYGTFKTARTFIPGDAMVVLAGALIVTLA